MQKTACEKEIACCYHVYKDIWAAAIGGSACV